MLSGHRTTRVGVLFIHRQDPDGGSLRMRSGMRRGALTLIAAVLLGLGDCVSQAGCTTRTASPLATGAEALGPAPAYHVSRLSLMDPVAKWQERGLGSLRAPLRGGTAIEDEVKFQDVTGDGGVLKLILREGVGEAKPRKGDEAYVHFNGSIASLDSGETIFNGSSINGQAIDSTSTGEGATLPRMFKVGSGNTIKGWDMAVPRMRRGERALFVIRSDYAYGASGRRMSSGVRIPPNTTLHFELELLRWNEKDLHNDGGVVMAYRPKPDPESPEHDRHPEENDEVLIEYEGRYEDEVFKTARPGGEWVRTEMPYLPTHFQYCAVQASAMLLTLVGEVRLGRQRLPAGLETLLTNEAVMGGTYNVTLAPEYAFKLRGFPPLVPGGATVQYRVKLLDWNSVHDRFLDGSLVVTCLGQPADTYAATARDCTKVNLTVEGRTTDGEVFFPQQTLTKVTVGNRQIPEALETGLALVRAGQRAIIFARSDRLADDVANFEYGDALKGDVVWEVKVESIQRTYQLNMHDRLHAARVRKEWGNALFQADRPEDALEKYQMAYEVIRPKLLTGGATPIPKVLRNMRHLQDHKEARELKAAIHLNKATCKQRLAKDEADWKGVIEECDLALEVRSTWSKALYRRGQAYLAVDEPERAAADITKVLEVDRGNAAARRLLGDIKERQRDKDSQDKAVFSRMMQPASDPETPSPGTAPKLDPSARPKARPQGLGGPGAVWAGLGGIVSAGMGGVGSVLGELGRVLRRRTAHRAAHTILEDDDDDDDDLEEEEEEERGAKERESEKRARDGSETGGARSVTPPPVVENLVRSLSEAGEAAGKAFQGAMRETGIGQAVTGGVGVAAEKIKRVGSSASNLTDAMGKAAAHLGERVGSGVGGMLGGRVGSTASDLSGKMGRAAGELGKRVGSAAGGLGEVMGTMTQSGAQFGAHVGQSASNLTEVVAKGADKMGEFMSKVPGAVDHVQREFVERSSIVGGVLNCTVGAGARAVVGGAQVGAMVVEQGARVTARAVEWGVVGLAVAARGPKKMLKLAGNCTGWAAPKAAQGVGWVAGRAALRGKAMAAPVLEELAMSSEMLRLRARDSLLRLARLANCTARKLAAPCKRRLAAAAQRVREHEGVGRLANLTRALAMCTELKLRDDPGRAAAVVLAMTSMFLSTYMLLVAGEGSADPTSRPGGAATKQAAGKQAEAAKREGKAARVKEGAAQEIEEGGAGEWRELRARAAEHWRGLRSAIREAADKLQTPPAWWSPPEAPADANKASAESAPGWREQCSAAAARLCAAVTRSGDGGGEGRDEADRQRVQQAQREQAQREQAQREQAQREQAQREQAQREKAQREQAQREKAQREKAQKRGGEGAAEAGRVRWIGELTAMSLELESAEAVARLLDVHRAGSLDLAHVPAHVLAQAQGEGAALVSGATARLGKVSMPSVTEMTLWPIHWWTTAKDLTRALAGRIHPWLSEQELEGVTLVLVNTLRDLHEYLLHPFRDT